MSSGEEWIEMEHIKAQLEQGGDVYNSEWEKLCIYRVPGWLKGQQYSFSGDLHCIPADNNTDSVFAPEIISLGPYYRGRPHLQAMEEHKWRVLYRMLYREKQNINIYLDEMGKIVDTVFACYERPMVNNIDTQQFRLIVVLDGCFLVEFLRVLTVGCHELGYNPVNDPIFSKDSIIEAIRRDIIKLENQIPYIVLEKLLELQYKQESLPKDRLIRLVLNALCPIKWVSGEVVNDKIVYEIIEKQVPKLKDVGKTRGLLHCLHILRLSLLDEEIDPNTKPDPGTVEAESVDDSNEGTVVIVYVVDHDMVVVGVDNASDLNHVAAEPLVEAGPSDGVDPNAAAGLNTTGDSDMVADGVDDSSDLNEVAAEPLVAAGPNGVDPNAAAGLNTTGDSNMVSVGVDDASDLNEVAAEPLVSAGHNDGVDPNAASGLNTTGNSDDQEMEVRGYSARYLKTAGVKFKNRKGHHFWDIHFENQRGSLEIPPIKIEYATKIVLSNLIAYEQCQFNTSDRLITNYVAFMDNLIDTAEDIELLHKAGIIIHHLGSDAEAANLFNTLTKGVFFYRNQGGHCELYKKLLKYTNQKSNQWRAHIWRSYFNNPLLVNSTIIGILFFFFTALQTGYTINSYYNPSSPKSGNATMRAT